jgi:hypothetical protein
MAMGHFMFFLFAVVAGLCWTAACTAAAARVERGWLKALLAAVGAALPVIALLPIVAASWWHAFGVRMQSHWFPQVFTVLVSLLIGGAWIVWGGLAPRDGRETPAARWPLIGLMALAAIAASVTAGVLLILDNAVAAQAPYLRLEAANLMQSNLPPIVADGENALALHLQAATAIAADKEFDAEGSPVDLEGDVMREEVTAFLARHAATLDLVRRAADRDTCRFTRDWSRPAIDMILSEIQTIRSESRLLALAARRAAAEGRHADALADIIRIQRLSRHAAAEPILVSYLVGIALDREALTALADLLPRLGADDAALLDSPDVRDLVGRQLDLLPALYGEEAFGLATFAGFADGRLTTRELIGTDQAGSAFGIFDVGPGFRVFHLPGDLDGYRRMMRAFQLLAEDREASTNYAETRRRAEALEKSLADHRPGVFSSLLLPAITSVFRTRACSEALHRAAAVLVTATKQRLATGELPLEPTAFAGPAAFAIPADPLAEGSKPLLMKRSDAGLSVYSVGPDGADDGGPAPLGEQAEEGNDDVGLVMAVQ